MTPSPTLRIRQVPELIPGVILDGFYTPLDEATTELRRRRSNKALCRAVAEFHRAHPPRFLSGEPSVIFVRSVFSPDFEFGKFAALSEVAGYTPLCLEITNDRFVSFNWDKYCRGKMTFRWGTHTRALHVMDFGKYDGKRFPEIPSLSGLPLVEFHHGLLARAYPQFVSCVRDFSDKLLIASSSWETASRHTSPACNAADWGKSESCTPRVSMKPLRFCAANLCPAMLL